jgi:hypothetical protein
LFYHEASDGKHFLFPRGAHGPLARRDRRCSPKSPLGKLYRPGKLVKKIFISRPHPPTPSALCTAPTERGVGVAKPPCPPFWDARKGH